MTFIYTGHDWSEIVFQECGHSTVISKFALPCFLHFLSVLPKIFPSLQRKYILALKSPLLTDKVRPWVLNVTDGWIFVLPPLLSSTFLPPGYADPLEAEAEHSVGVMTPTDIGLMMVHGTTPT